MGIKFANGGFITTIQDMGRTGYQEFGVPAAGVMDTMAFRKANILVGTTRTRPLWRSPHGPHVYLYL